MRKQFSISDKPRVRLVVDAVPFSNQQRRDMLTTALQAAGAIGVSLSFESGNIKAITQQGLTDNQVKTIFADVLAESVEEYLTFDEMISNAAGNRNQEHDIMKALLLQIHGERKIKT